MCTVEPKPTWRDAGGADDECGQVWGSSEEHQMRPSSNAAAATVTAAVVTEARIRAVSLAKSCVDHWLELRQRTNEEEEIVFHLTEQEMQSTTVRVTHTIISLPCRIPSCSVP